MTEERKKRFYPKRGAYVVDDYAILYKPASKGRTEIDDSEWIAEAVKGIDCGIYKNANQAALRIAIRLGGHSIDQKKKRIAGKVRRLLRSKQS